MRLVVGLLAVCVISGNAKEPHRKPAVPARKNVAAAPARKVIPVPQIPADAKRVDENTFVHTNTKGETWYYRRTPFGVTAERASASVVPPPSTERPLAPFTDSTKPAPGRVSEEEITAVESGESVRFERSTPFGKQVWTRRIGELNEEERAVLGRIRERAAQTPVQ
jgi:hypothetical protein